MSNTEAQRQVQFDIDGVVAAHRLLEAHVAGLTDDVAHGASALPNWTVAHVLTHVARNAESFVRLLSGVATNIKVSQYEGGRDQRNGDIEVGASRDAATIVADVLETNAALESALATIDPSWWEREVEFMVGLGRAADVPWRRWREVAVHHIDLGFAYRWTDWPESYVRIELRRMTMLWSSRKPMGLTALPSEAMAVGDAHRLAWLLGRASIDGLEPAGLMA